MSLISYKCPNCGGELVFDPDSGQYSCPFCQSFFTQEEIDALTPKSGTEAASSDEEAAGDTGEAKAEGKAVVYSCPSCGAEIVTDETTAATFCYYCHNPVVMEGKVSGDFLPDKIIPFKIGRESAVRNFLDYTSRKIFIPRAFFNAEQIDKMTGVYYPYWVYDSDVDGEISGTATKLRVWRVGDTEYTETSRYQVSRSGRISMGNLTRNALRKTDRQLVENVQPFELSGAVDFSMGYLSGFVAEKRDMEKEEFAGALTDECSGYASKLLEETISGYSTVHIDNRNLKKIREHFSYMLLPVWVLTYRSKAGKMYYYAMNGQTGKIYGELPLDLKRVAVFGAIVFIVVSIIAMIVGYMM